MKSSKSPLQILLVEDDEIDIQSIERILKKVRKPIELHIAKNGVEALEMLNSKMKQPPQLIILDINMPKMNGIEFLNKLRNDPNFRNLSVLILTTSSSEKDKLSALNLNVAGYLLKPMQPEYFLSYCTMLLDNTYGH